MKTLKNILATSALVLGLTGLNGCGGDYGFKGEIDGENIGYITHSNGFHHLTVVKPGGVRLEFYEGVGGDSLIDEFEVYQDGLMKFEYSSFFCSTNRDLPVIQEAQKQWDNHRARILSFKEETKKAQEEMANEFYHKRDSLALEALKSK
jgi:hypothetical protein